MSALPLIASVLVGTASAQIPAHATVLNPTQAVSLAPVLAQAGDTVHTFALAGANGLLYARSPDGGRTWPVRELALAPFAAALSDPFGDVSVLGDSVVVVGYHPTSGPAVVRSGDGGVSWSAPFQLAGAVVPQATTMSPRLYRDGTTIVATWTNDRGAAGRVFCNRSIDGGLTWTGEVQLDLGAPASTSAVTAVRLAGSGPIVHVFWNEFLVLHTHSLDGGATWLPATATLPLQPVSKAVADGATVLAIAGRGALARSADFGATWTPMTVPGMNNALDIARDGQVVVAVGQASSPWTVVVNTSPNLGATWQAPLLLPSTAIFTCTAAALPGELYLSFRASGLPGGAARSIDNGTTWQGIAGPVSAAFCPGRRRAVHLAWTQPTGSHRLFHAYIGVGDALVGTGTAGTGNLVPELAANGLPLLGQTTVLQVEEGVGGAVGGLGVSFVPPAPTPFGSALLWLATVDVLVPFLASGPVGQPGAGSFGLPVIVPAAPALVGASLTAQALLLDTGAIDGFAVTNAIEAWLR
ncbi:MAG: sialidase family protein [Planctomycetota bacterium]